MGVVDRLKKLRQLGREVNMQFDLDKAIEINELSFSNIADYKEMVATNGWQILETQLLQHLEGTKRKIIDLAKDPERNAAELMVLYAVKEVITRIIRNVTGVLGSEDALKRERDKLMERVIRVRGN